MKMKQQSEEKSGRTKIHNVRFYNLAPRSILCFAYGKVWHKLALSRNDGSIEIWDMQHAPCLEKTIPKSPGDSIEGLAWAGERLFSAGLNGELVEWNLQTLKPLRKQHVTGNAIWCLDINSAETELAIGTEEGYINIFDISDDLLVYKTLFDKQEGRVLCCKFDGSGEFLVTGSIDTVRIWDVRTGHALHKMSVPRTEKKKEVIVWSLQVLRDFTIITGDSLGQIIIWDGKTASLVETHQVLKADVLAVAVNESENLLMCSGIEPVIRLYAKTQIKREDMLFNCWVKYLQRKVHDHDVKALLCVGDNILSGGMDGYLGVSSVAKAKSVISKYGPFLQNPCVTVAAPSKLLLFQYTNYLEIWRIGSTSGKRDELQDTEDDENKKSVDQPKGNLLTLDTVPEKLLQFKSRHEERIVCASLSPNGQWLCYSTQNIIRLFRFVPAVAGQCATQLSRVEMLPEQFTAATHIHFSADSKRLFLVNGDTKQILIFAILSNGSSDLDFVESIEVGKHIKDVISIFTVSQCGSYVVAAGTCRTIAVWSVFKGKHFKHHLNLPRYVATTTAIAMHEQQPRLVASFSDGKIFEYDLDEMCFTCSDKDYFVSSAENHCVSTIVLDKRNPDVFILHNDANLFVLEKSAAVTIDEDETASDTTEGTKKQRKDVKKTKQLLSDKKVVSLRLKFEKTYEHFIHLSWLSSDELVAVGVNPKYLLEQLPGAFKQKLFGVA